MPFSIFRLRTLVGANAAGLILGTELVGMFLMLTLYMQQVFGYSPMRTGVAYLAVAGTAIVWSGLASQLVTRVGVKPVLAAGMAFLTAGLVYFTQVSVGGSYLGDLLPGFLLIAVGIGFSFVPISIAALAGVQASEAGLASGLFNTSQQIGGALGIAPLSAVATSPAARPSLRAYRRLPGRLRRRRGRRPRRCAYRAPRCPPRTSHRKASRRSPRSSRPPRRERAHELKQLRGAVDGQRGGLAELRRPLGPRHPSGADRQQAD